VLTHTACGCEVSLRRAGATSRERRWAWTRMSDTCGSAGGQMAEEFLHRRRSVIVRMTAAGEVLESTRIVNDADRARGRVAALWGVPGGGAGGHLRLVLGRGRVVYGSARRIRRVLNGDLPRNRHRALSA